jgi:hypothetical protein
MSGGNERDWDQTDPKENYRHHKATFPKTTKPYRQWLEDQFRIMVRDIVHPTADEAGALSEEDGATLVETRVYHAACVAERFEPGRKYCGNGHHLAQRVAAFAKAEFLKACPNHKAQP